MSLTAAIDLGSPEKAARAFCEAINRGDLEAAASCFTRDAFLITPDATAVRGREAISGVLAQMIAADVELSVRASGLLRAGSVAIAHEAWSIRSRAPEGASYARESKPTLVLQQLDSHWKLAIAAPWGWGG